MDKILNFLRQLDLSEIEAKLYLTLMQTGPTSVRELAEHIEIKRTTTYFYIDQLIEKGLIIKLVKGSKKLVAANEPNYLKTLVDQKVASAKMVQENFSDIITSLTANMPDTKEVDKAEIRYYKDKTGVQRVYEEALNSSEIRLYVNLEELERLMMPNSVGFDYMLFENALQKNPNLKIYEIIADTPGNIEQFSLDETLSTSRYFYKFLPSHVGLTSPGILLYDNKVATISGKGKLEMVVLSNADYYINSKKLFDFIWELLPNPTKNK